LLPALIVVGGVVVPLIYLFIRAFQADFQQLDQLVVRYRSLQLLYNTVALAAGVLAFSTVIALPMAWLTTRAELIGRRFFTLLGVLPLAIPGYVMAYALLASTGPYGTLADWVGVTIPRLSGYTGALLALSLYTFPYLFLNLRAALIGLDASLEESARSLGYTAPQVFFKVILPQLRPAFYAGGLLIGLHVLGDFGVVSLMRYETFSYALYLQYTAAYDRIYAAWLAIMLLVLTGGVLFLEAHFLRGLRFYRSGSGPRRRASTLSLGKWKVAAYLFLGLTGLTAVGLPLITITYWMGDTLGSTWSSLGSALWASVSASGPAAILASSLALPIAYMTVRFPSTGSRLLERASYLGYAIPPLAFALAVIFFTLQVVPWIYQTLLLLIIVYALHFLGEAMGPLRSAMYQTSPSLEEAARSLGRSQMATFATITFPLLRRGMLVGTAFVFLSAMKELPLTFLLSPTGFDTLALNVWSYANEAMFAEASPYALTIVIFSAGFVGLLLIQEREA
jgi:iron(III) transport system permease protein